MDSCSPSPDGRGNGMMLCRIFVFFINENYLPLLFNVCTKIHTQFAKSSRSSCKKCKSKIEKGAIRIGVHSEVSGKDYTMSSWYHPSCFNLPRKYATGADKMTAEQFLEDIMEDTTGGEILPSRKDEIAEQISSKATPKKGGKSEENDRISVIQNLKDEFNAMAGNGEKKRKSSGGDELSPKRAKELDVYGEVHTLTNDKIKAELRWNNQVMTGNKDLLVAKLIDGRMNGRVALCSGCGGKLKFNDSGDEIVCMGRFDEDTQLRVPCRLTYTLDSAPRFMPWYTIEPTEEEKEEMKRVMEEAREGGAVGAEVDGDSDLGKLMENAKKLKINWNGKENKKVRRDDRSTFFVLLHC